MEEEEKGAEEEGERERRGGVEGEGGRWREREGDWVDCH